VEVSRLKGTARNDWQPQAPCRGKQQRRISVRQPSLARIVRRSCANPSSTPSCQRTLSRLHRASSRPHMCAEVRIPTLWLSSSLKLQGSPLATTLSSQGWRTCIDYKRYTVSELERHYKFLYPIVQNNRASISPSFHLEMLRP
jgi:hypothetical protein